MHVCTGPVAGIQEQYVTVSPDSLNIAAQASNYFIHTGSGNDAISVLGVTNVLAGGTGTDTFYVDDRGASATQADMASQRLTVQYGHDAASASNYLYVHDNR